MNLFVFDTCSLNFKTIGICISHSIFLEIALGVASGTGVGPGVICRTRSKPVGPGVRL